MSGVKSSRAFVYGNLMMLVATIIFGFNLPIQKLLIPHEMSAIDVSVCRIVGGAALFWLASLFLKREKIDRGDWRNIIISGALCLFGFLWLYAIAIEYSSVIDVSLVLTSQPILIILIDAIFYKYKISRWEMVGVLICLAGAIFVIIAGGSHSSVHASRPILGNLCAVGCSVCYSVYICMTRKASDKYHPWTLNKWLFLFAAIPAIPFLFHLPSCHLFQQPSLMGMGELGFVVILASFACYFMIPPSIRDIGSDLVGIYAYLTPVAATVIALVLKIDVLKWEQPVAFAVIIVGVVIITKAKRKLRAQRKSLMLKAQGSSKN